MSDYEMLSLMMAIIAVIVKLLLEIIKGNNYHGPRKTLVVILTIKSKA